MTASLHHHVRAAGACYQQAQQRCAVMPRPVVARAEDMAVHQVFAGTTRSGKPVMISVWNKKTGTGNQN